MKSPKQIVKQMAAKARMDCVISSRRGEVGEYIKRLSPEEREVLKELKAEDIKSDVPYLPR
jgi:hypothetical protein